MSPASTIVRALFCLLVVFGTWNPAGVSYLSWVRGGAGTAPTLVAVGAILFALNLLLVRIAWLSLGIAGIVLIMGLTLFGTLSLVELGLLPRWHPFATANSPLLAVSAVLTAGLNWSIIKRRLLGQSNVINPPP